LTPLNSDYIISIVNSYCLRAHLVSNIVTMLQGVGIYPAFVGIHMYVSTLANYFLPFNEQINDHNVIQVLTLEYHFQEDVGYNRTSVVSPTIIQHKMLTSVL